MKNKYLLIISGISLLFFSSCSMDVAIKNSDEAEKLINTIYPKNIESTYDLVTRYETKEPFNKLKDFKWKKNNDYLEKMGLLKQIYTDSAIQFYVQSQARFESRRQYVYSVILSPRLKSWIVNSNKHVKQYDEYDYSNRHTCQKQWLTCKVLLGQFKIDKIIDINQEQKPFGSEIKYYEKYFATAFNDIIKIANQYKNGDKVVQKIVAKRYNDEACKLIY